MVSPGKPLSKERGVVSETFLTRSIPTELTRWTAAVEEQLRQHALDTDSLLGLMAAYHMGWVDPQGNPAQASGKHVRSNLCCWAAEACGASGEVALPAACAIELAHNFTLVHDDVQDGDKVRRGRPAVWSVWGAAQAINAGDGLFALALRTLLGGSKQEYPSGERGRRSQAAGVILDALLEVIEGQCQDLKQEGSPNTPLAAYLTRVEAKTGALFGASLESGALMAGAEPHARQHLGRAGRLLGVAFQLRDDWLGVWGEPALTGKSRHNDLARRKLTHPIVVALGAAGAQQRRQLGALYQSRDPEQEPEIRRLLESLGGPELTVADAGHRAAEAVAEVERSGLAAARVQEFVDVASYLAERNH
jgi:geranylgeranyl diphosphate synthase type I